MSAAPIEPVDPATDPQAPAAAAPVEPAESSTPVEPASKKAVWEDPDSAKAEIERLRKENGAARTNAKAQAAEEARNELAQAIGKALGLVENEPVDPAKLTAQLTAEQSYARQARMELAVFRNAGDHADPSALLDSRTFLEKVATIDPHDSQAIQAAISEAVEANPRLGKAPAAPGMKPNPAQGRSASPPLGVGEQIAAAQKAGDIKSVLRLKASQALQNGPSA
jgi:hypothetical protein